MFELKKRKKFDPIAASRALSGKLPGSFGSDAFRRRLLDMFLKIGIPFNRWLGLKIKELSDERVVIESPPTVLRRNHVGTAHACAQALIGEYAAGLVIVQHFSFDVYRIIISKLEIDYLKAGRGKLYGTACSPEAWPETVEGEAWVDMETRITDENGVSVAVCRTRWQIKSWQRIEADRASRSAAKL